MEAIVSIRPLLAVLVSAVGAILIISSHRNPNRREFWSLLASGIKFLIVISMIPSVMAGNVLEYTLVEPLPGIGIKFRVDALGLTFASIASFLWIITSLYSIGYMRTSKEHAQTRYFACFAVTLSATIGVAFSANLLTLYVFYEIITMSTYALVAHRETPEAWIGGKKYITYLLGTSKAFLLPAIILTYNAVGTLEFSKTGIFSATTDSVLITIIFVLFIAGFAKSAIMPLHSWLPAAMVAPTPVSALLHAVAVVKVGVFCILRVALYIFGLDTLKELNLGFPLVLLASFTIITASMIALTKDNLKARLAYSTISQLSYIILGVALLTPSGLTGGILHIANHAFAKITLFLCVGAIAVALHKTKVSELNGIGKQMPFTMAAFTLGALSLIAIPPFGGFISKWYLAIGSIEAEQYLVIAVLVTSTILNACYFLPIVYAAFFRDLPPGEKAERREAPTIMVVPLMLTAIATLVLFFAPSVFLDMARMVTGEVMR